ncbi:hypothetical protein K7X08_011139 [Anisodus acutangulus]|uniref:Uncharacterized protein n=1 Tax=Anisodus acutangulus TaxID=402998 RepID=A0A9Q1M1T1_9SOLA|nr:hypothetical protein K7X08_011139 [Anisodus acutangulus]
MRNRKYITGNGELQLIPAIVEIPLLLIGSTFSTFGDLIMVNMQHFDSPMLGGDVLYVLSTCRYDQLKNREFLQLS